MSLLRNHQASSRALAVGGSLAIAILSAISLAYQLTDMPIESHSKLSTALQSFAFLLSAIVAAKVLASADASSAVSLDVHQGSLQELPASQRIINEIFGEEAVTPASVYFGDLRCSSCVSMGHKYALLSGLNESHRFHVDIGRTLREPVRIGRAAVLDLGNDVRRGLGIDVSPSLLVIAGTTYELYKGKEACSAALSGLIPE